MKTKICSRCLKEKSTKNFSPNKNNCKLCRNIENKNYYSFKKYGEADFLIKKKESETKICKVCESTKDKIFFLKRKEGLDGYRNICLDCHYEKQRIREREWRRNNHNQRLSKYISNKIWLSLKGKKYGIHWQKLVGYTLEELKINLEQNFVEYMSWENYGKWHIDHVRPVSSFNITSYHCEDFKKCWALSNLQPLWAIDNKRKYNKIL